MRNCTLTGNTALNGVGGAIDNRGTLTVVNTTVSDNAATASAGGIANTGTLNLRNSIVANSTGADVSADGTVNADYSLIEDGSGAPVGSNNLTGDPMLGPLQNNGGPTLTRALLPGSIAINVGSNALAVDEGNLPLVEDQRGFGFARIVESTVDLGAFETAHPGSVRFASATANALEGSTQTLTIEVQRIEGSVGAISVDFATADGSATAGQDYVAQSGTLSWAAGDTSPKQIELEFLEDTIYEGTEEFHGQPEPAGRHVVRLTGYDHDFLRRGRSDAAGRAVQRQHRDG